MIVCCDEWPRGRTEGEEERKRQDAEEIRAVKRITLLVPGELQGGRG